MARRSLQDILSSDESFSTAPTDTGAEDAYNKYLDASEAQRRREEGAATEGVLNNLQSRGLARSGIALKDIVNQVLGPSSERAATMAANFGLNQAQTANQNLEAAKGRRLSAILQSDQGDLSQLLEQNQIDAASRLSSQQNRTARQNALLGAAGGIVGAGIKAYPWGG